MPASDRKQTKIIIITKTNINKYKYIIYEYVNIDITKYKNTYIYIYIYICTYIWSMSYFRKSEVAGPSLTFACLQVVHT